MALHESILRYKERRYLKVALTVVGSGCLAYALHDPMGRPNGGTWLGYTLGILSAALVLWLMAYGMRKRQYGGGGVKLQEWLSAHVYLGLALTALATLHTGFQFGLNVHTLAYALTLLVIGSGFVGLVAYIRLPRLVTANERGLNPEQMLQLIAQLDGESRDAARELDDDINQAVLRSCAETPIGGSLIQQLRGRVPGCPTALALSLVSDRCVGKPDAERLKLQSLLTVLARKNDLVRRLRRDIRYRALMRIWLAVHLPTSFALLAALTTHVVAVLFYR